jgi:hypothetical protein
MTLTIQGMFARTPARPARKAHLGLESLDRRDLPSVTLVASALPANPGVIRSFNPQPEPPGSPADVGMSDTRGIIAITRN